MMKPVLFCQAVERAARENDYFDFAIEIGPHPALRAPFTEAFKAVTGMDIPYYGLLNRNEDDRTAFSDALGSIWSRSRSMPGMPSIIDWRAVGKACTEKMGCNTNSDYFVICHHIAGIMTNRCISSQTNLRDGGPTTSLCKFILLLLFSV
jgi:hypothetical protein